MKKDLTTVLLLCVLIGGCTYKLQTAHPRNIQAERQQEQNRRVQELIDAERYRQAKTARDLLDAAEAIRREPELFGVRRSR